MFCPNCNQKREEKDFFGKLICYKCEYERKTNPELSIPTCKICEKPLPPNRWAYCSPECGIIGEKNMKRDYWVKKVKTDYKWKRFKF